MFGLLSAFSVAAATIDNTEGGLLQPQGLSVPSSFTVDPLSLPIDKGDFQAVEKLLEETSSTVVPSGESPAPTPAPVPALVPDPAPALKPAPVPAPVPVPDPAPALKLAPVPAPALVPDPAPTLKRAPAPELEPAPTSTPSDSDPKSLGEQPRRDFGQAANLEDIYTLARANDPRFLAADYEKQSAQFDVSIARAARRPSLSLQFRREHEYDSLLDEDEENRTESGLTLDVPLYNHRSNVNIDLAKSVVEEAALNFLQQEQTLFIRTADLYFSLLRAEDSEHIARAALEAIEGQVELAKELRAEKLAAVFDVKEAEASFDSAKATLIEAQGEVSAAREALRVAINQYPPELARIGENSVFILPQPSNVEYWITQGRLKNTALQLAQWQNRRSSLELAQSRADHYPTLGLSSTYSYIESDLSTNDESKNGEVSILLNVPLYRGGRVFARSAQLKLKKLQIQQQLVLAERGVEQQIRNAYDSVHTSYRRSLALEQAVVSNRSSLELIQEGVKEQVRTIVDLLEVTSRYTRAQLELSGARYDFLFNVLLLHAFSGELSVDDLETLDQVLQ